LTCVRMNRYLSSIGTKVCAHGHLRLANQTRCKTCRNYRAVPWMKVLDENGTTVCPNGHEVSHHDDSTIIFCKDGSRQCKACRADASAKAREVHGPTLNKETCRNGLHPWPESRVETPSGHVGCRLCRAAATQRQYWARKVREEKVRPLDPEWIDWVVVMRALAGPMGVAAHNTFRGATRGMTDGEKWVAYCSYKLQYGEPVGEGRLAGRPELFARWRDETAHYKWPVVTVWDIMQELPSARYRNNKYLKG
jgi:hypothetical protein